MADFTGFYYDSIHSSTYHLIRISDGDRYKEGLFPEFEDRTIELVGGIGSLYQGTKFRETEFTIKAAYEGLTEQDFKNIRNWLEPDKLKEFRFDERPYKAYWAKIKETPRFEYVCFLEDDPDSVNGGKRRVYKGEVELKFIAYNPFGFCNNNQTKMTSGGLVTNTQEINWQVLKSYVPFITVEDNTIEWAETSGLKNEDFFAEYNKFTESASGNSRKYQSQLFNPGDFDADFELFLDFRNKTKNELEGKSVIIYITELLPGQTNTASIEGKTHAFKFSVSGLNNNSRDTLVLNTNKHSLLVYHYREDGACIGKSMRYDLVSSTDWIKIPKGESIMKVQVAVSGINPQIKYGYRYY